MSETLLLVVYPYVCLVLMITGIIINISSSKLRISAPATGFFENKKQFWGSVLWHYGIIFVLAGHLTGALFPSFVKSISADYRAMLALETAALAFGLSALIGVLIFWLRRLTERTVSANSSPTDYIALAVLSVQIITGLIIAVGYRWGISWYASNFSGYLHDIFTLKASAAKAAGMPPVVVLHIVCAFTLFALLPYTRLMHLLYVPFRYLARKPQVSIFYDNRK